MICVQVEDSCCSTLRRLESARWLPMLCQTMQSCKSPPQIYTPYAIVRCVECWLHASRVWHVSTRTFYYRPRLKSTVDGHARYLWPWRLTVFNQSKHTWNVLDAVLTDSFHFHASACTSKRFTILLFGAFLLFQSPTRRCARSACEILTVCVPQFRIRSDHAWTRV